MFHDKGQSNSVGELEVTLAEMLKTNRKHRNEQEINFMLEEYMFGHQLNLTEAAMVEIW